MDHPRLFLRNPLFMRALVLGALTGIALILVHVFSTRGPLIFIPYAAMFAALAPLLARYRETFVARATAGFVAFVTATLMGYVYILAWANPGVPHLSLLGFARFAFVLSSGAILAAAVAFLVGGERTERAA